MKLIDRRTHAVLDYLTAGALLALPPLMGWRSPAGRFASLLGAATAAYSALTDYELAVRRVLPFRTHLLLDTASALAFLAAPLLFRGERAQGRAALLGLGLFELGAVLLTQPGGRRPGRPTYGEQTLAGVATTGSPATATGRPQAGPPSLAPGDDPDAGALEAFGDDVTTTDRVRSRLGRELQSDQLARLNINTQAGGVVFLRGQIHTEEQRARILAIVGDTHGVGDIVDELEIAREA